MKYISPKPTQSSEFNEDSLPLSVEDYLNSGAAEGGRNNALFAAAAQLRDIDMSESEAASILTGRASSDGLSETESSGTIASAFRSPKREAPTSNGNGKGGGNYDRNRGGSSRSMAKGRTYDLGGGNDFSGDRSRGMSASDAGEDALVRAIASAGNAKLPEPMETGFEMLLRAAFNPGDGVCVGEAFINDDGDPKPEGGNVHKRERLIELVRKKGGDFSKLFTAKDGHYIRLNAMDLKKGSRHTNADVTNFRHVLVEFDTDAQGRDIPKEKQYGALLASGLPITAVIDSGNKSLHGWVQVNAKDAAEYKERASKVYSLFNPDHLDGQNHNPNRYSRTPDGRRTVVKGGEKTIVHQRLLRLNLGADDWDDWQHKQNTADLGETWTVDDLEDYPVHDDPNTVIGNRWMCKGGSFVLVSQSGVGKSSIQMQFTVAWALMRKDMSFGIEPKKPLKQVIIQAENDQGDVAEAWQDITKAYSLTKAEKDEVKSMVTWRRLTSCAGELFLAKVRLIVAESKPDICWIDPLINYIGDDISKAEVISDFCDIGLGSISRDTGCIFGIIHHSGKPKSAADKNGTTASDLAYMGLGSSNLTNWAREVLVLNRVKTPDATDPATFSLTATKRRTRAGMKFMPADGDPIDAELPMAEIYVRHSDDGTIRWEQCPEPEEGKGGRQKKVGSKPRLTGMPNGRPSSLSVEQKREIVAACIEHGGKMPVKERSELATHLRKSSRTIARYLKKLEENAALVGGQSLQDALEADIENSEDDIEEVIQGSELD